MISSDHNTAKYLNTPRKIARYFAQAGRPLAAHELVDLEAQWAAWNEGCSFHWVRPNFIEGTANEVRASFTPMDQVVSA